MTITTTVKTVACRRVGQLTCFNSARVSFIYSPILIYATRIYELHPNAPNNSCERYSWLPQSASGGCLLKDPSRGHTDSIPLSEKLSTKKTANRLSNCRTPTHNSGDFYLTLFISRYPSHLARGKHGPSRTRTNRI